ncbi:hypothetical protein PF008_g12343 [Phytophthora fragariae]|uniref:Uncharacterized protein n=1 Tax=Phytophthora fragariae TaxID=53985 RepID=A0A6G0RP20_9STRA|nr:hypothetical protein PF008_g12343 [Phytophthora fragariae]
MAPTMPITASTMAHDAKDRRGCAGGGLEVGARERVRPAAALERRAEEHEHGAGHQEADVHQHHEHAGSCHGCHGLTKLKEMHAAHPEDVDVICRLTRAAYDVSNLKATSTDEKMELMYYARDVIQKGLDLTKDVAAVHNW